MSEERKLAEQIGMAMVAFNIMWIMVRGIAGHLHNFPNCDKLDGAL